MVSHQPVEAVFVIFYNLSAHKAVYGRGVGGDGYTKDYIQLVQDPDFREALEQLFPREPGEKSTPIEYRWPGGSSPGSIEFESADRPHLAWLKKVGAPQPWKMIVAPTSETVETVPGDPGHTDAVAATTEFHALGDKGCRPYLVAVKLRNEANVLHVRAYIENPTPDLRHAGVELLPAAVHGLVEKATHNRAFKWALFDSCGVLVPPEVEQAVVALEENPNLLLTGPPGTGKTVLLEQLADFVENPGQGIFFDPDSTHDAWKNPPATATPGKATALVLHPSYQYDNLVLGLLPQPAENGGVGIRVSTGPLVNLAHYASEPDRQALLVLDEFNRANAAAVLGDTLALLDKDKRGRAHINLPYEDLIIQVPEEYAANGTTEVAPQFTLPPNLWIVAAMNTSDRSVAPLDAALRRRFTIVERQPDYDLLSGRLGGDDDEQDLSVDIAEWTCGHVGRLASDLLRSLNGRIDAVLGTDFRLGHSNFWHVDGKTVDAALLSLATAFDRRIVQTLRLSLQDDDAALAAILRAGADQSPRGGNSSVAYWVRPSSELGTFASSRLHIREISALPSDKILAELKYQAELDA